jgi:hypothetical protein
MSASATNYIVSNGNYINTDLNAIFAPISRGTVDYGTFNSTPTYLGNGTPQSYIAESWCLFNTPIRNSSSAGNITITDASGASGGGFNIVNAGNYKLSVTLFFNGNSASGSYQYVLFILNSTDTVPSTTTTTFTPAPNMGQIYSINCSGGASIRPDDGDIENINNFNLTTDPFSTDTTGNLLNVRSEATNINTNPYYFSFFASSARSNIYTLDITFNATAGQDIYPQIVCQEFGVYANPINTLNGTASKWAFFKL